MDDGSKLLLLLKTLCWYLMATEREAVALTFDLVTACYADSLRVEAYNCNLLSMRLKTKGCALKPILHIFVFNAAEI